MSEQERHLDILRRLVIVAVGLVVIVGGLLYLGIETPPRGMSESSHDATGYRPPPDKGFPIGTVARGGLERVLPDPADGSVPPAAATLVNPERTDPRAVKLGGVEYLNNCSMCHGVTGHGDGPVSDSYQPRAPDLTTRRVREQPDGVIFYKITNGILSTPIAETKKYLPREWHAWRNEMSQRERWQAVTYVRTLETPNATSR
ncbi:MAG TPA: c-type cytochrome [Armatimonadota bacterium]|jgi:mono/diheme cytochrome c family protein